MEKDAAVLPQHSSPPPAARVEGVRRWVWPRRDEAALALERELTLKTQVSPLLARLLHHRGVTDPDAVRAFLDPALAQLHDPFLLPDMDKAVSRLGSAIDKKEPVLLYADYDVDGNSGAAVLHSVLKKLGAVVTVHVPDRVKDGYGLKRNRLAQAAADGVKVVVSIDSGVTAIEEANFCREVGIDLIVTDHHTMKSELPRALAVIHPRVPGSKYPNPHICGAGVAFKLAWAVAQDRGVAGANGKKKPTPVLREALLASLGLVALGTVADVVALEGENRAMVRYGLRALELGPTAGIRALVGVAETEKGGMVQGGLDATHIAFQLAPRLNAAGRMGDATRAFKLLAAETDDEARALASELDRENSRRRGVQKETTEAARIEVARVYGDSSPPALVVAGEGWPLGVVGIVAAKLVEDHRRPVLCLTIDGDVAKGSGRSVPGFDLLKALDRCKDNLETYGGHAAACGLVIKTENLAAFREAWTAAAAAELAGTGAEKGPGDPTLEIDCEVDIRDVTQDFLRELALLEPHGQGNRPPLFAARGLTLAGEPRPMGRAGDHCQFFVRSGDTGLRVVAFGKRDLVDLLRARAMSGPNRQPFELAFRPKLNRWNGSVSVELEFEDIRFASA